MFNENSGLVKMWVQAVNEGKYTREQVPNLSNLRTIVYGILDAQVASAVDTNEKYDSTNVKSYKYSPAYFGSNT